MAPPALITDKFKKIYKLYGNDGTVPPRLDETRRDEEETLQHQLVLFPLALAGDNPWQAHSPGRDSTSRVVK